MMGGPSAQAKANEEAQTNFFNQMVAQQNETFGQQQELLTQIKAVAAPILAAGPNQYGFTTAEDQALRTEISNNANAGIANATTAAELRNKQATGGTDVLGTGAQQELAANADILGEQSKAEQLSQEKLAGFQAGSTNYENAVKALSGVAGLQNPTAYAGATTGAGNAATGAINLADSERSQLLNSLLGGAAQGALGVATGGLGNALGTLPGIGNFFG
jgi:hypothetical protein